MKTEEIKVLIGRTPFRPFTIETTGGKQILVSEETDILLPERRPELVIALTEDGSLHLVEDEAIASLESN